MATKRRGKGTGGVRAYKRKGKMVGWRVEISRKLPDGTHYRKSKTFLSARGRTRMDAEKWNREQLAKLDSGEIDATGTVEEWAADWMKTHRANAAVTNWTRDQETINRHIVPRIGFVRLSALTAATVNAWLGELHEAGVSASERKRAAATLKKMLRSHERVPRKLWDRVKLPRHRPKETRHLTPTELAVLIQTADSWEGHFGAMTRVAVDCGTRAGELLGLKWGDYDPGTGRLSFARSVCRRTGDLKDLKTDRSRRTLPLSAATRTALDALLRGKDDASIFPAPNGGGHYRYANWRQNVFTPLIKAAGLCGTGVVTKSLRHTCASGLIAAGVNILVVSRRLGHADAAMTLRVYSHLMPDDQDRAAEAIEKLFAAG